jgi:hypothetical protein
MSGYPTYIAKASLFCFNRIAKKLSVMEQARDCMGRWATLEFFHLNLKNKEML